MVYTGCCNVNDKGDNDNVNDEDNRIKGTIITIFPKLYTDTSAGTTAITNNSINDSNEGEFL